MQSISPLLVFVWLCFIVGCRDFKDCRTPCKSFVEVVINPLSEGDALTVTKVSRKTPDESVLLQRFANNFLFELPLNPNTDSVQFEIYTSTTKSPTKVGIYYHRQSVLISHQCGCAYKYTIKKMTITSGKYKILNKELSAFNNSNIDIQISL